MLTLGVLGFAAPWILTALAALPVLYWLLRVTPPTPRRIVFPPLRLLRELLPKEETPAHTPWWLLLLRLLIAALVIIALARPLLDPEARLAGTGPVMIVLDDGWAASHDWSNRLDAALNAADEAERAGRAVVLLGTAPLANGDAPRPSGLLPAAEARNILRGWQPKPWATDRLATARALQQTRFETQGDAVWIGDGLDTPGEGSPAYALAERLMALGGLQAQQPRRAARLLLPPALDGANMTIRAQRAQPGPAETVHIIATAEQGRVLAREPLIFAAGETQGEIQLGLPIELRNRLTRLDIEGGNSAGTTVLLDERWRRRPVGLVAGASLETRQPLLSDLYYLERALTPFSEVRVGGIGELLQRELAVLMLADIGQVVGEDRRRLDAWIEQGGVLVRFAGPRLAENSDELVPVRVRTGGGRQLGGALSWSEPARLAAFPDIGPFAGLAIAPDVTVSRQVLAEPDINLGDKTWARLGDGTPLVTGEQRGQGWLVLVHTTANTSWSNLALSGTFVEMLRRLVDLSKGIASADARAALSPFAVLDGFGRLGTPGPAAQAIAAADLATVVPGPRNPAGLYGPEDGQRALNLSPSVGTLMPIPRWPDGARVRTMGEGRVLDLLPWLLVAAIMLLIADLALSFVLRGMGPRAVRLAAGLGLAALLFAPAPDAAAQTATPRGESFAVQAATELRFAYVTTGNGEVDNMSRAGLTGLTDVLFRRTTIEAAAPFGVDLERDEIAFFPFLYWPLVPTQPDLSAAAIAKIDRFMKTGGLILFDTRDQGYVGFGAGRTGPGTQKLRTILGRLDIPPLAPVPPDHVLTKAFYLMQDFPGRYANGQVWVERHQGATNDGVTSMVIGGNDWASAWAIDGQGRPVAALVPGTPTQREMAYRFGINLVMYALTGNYKADQVHVPALLERLGQ